MAVTAALESSTLSVEPGDSVSGEVTVRNDGDAAVQVALSVTGPARPYSWLAPDTLQVPPGAQAVARIGFHMPRTSVPAAGPLAFAVEVAAAGSPAVVVPGTLDVRPFTVLSATLSPAQPDGKGPARHELTVGNRGNAPATAALRVATEGEVEVRVQPASVVVAPGGKVSATVEVSPRKRVFTGEGRTHAFRVVAEPDVGAPVEVGGQFRQEPAVAPRAFRTGVIAGVVAVVALVAGVVALAGGGDRPSEDVAVGAPPVSDCPARNHKDPHGITGLRPDDIPNLPSAYSFFAVASDECTPIRFNPCEPIHYVINPANAPPSGVEDVREAFNKLAQATGMTFVDEGFTDETSRRNPYVPDRYPGRWAPILVVWEPFGQRDGQGEVQVVGRGSGMRSGDVYVSGMLRLNSAAVTDREGQVPVQGGFGPQIGTGVGAIGPEGVTWGRIILHELGHVVGLGHIRDKDQIMYPETADQTFRPSEYRAGDLEGLRLLGREAGCLQTPPVPA
jgi:hypothetical protein